MWTSQNFCFWYWTIFIHCWPTECLEFKLVGHSLRYWFEYVCYSTIKVAFQASLSYLTIYFMTLLLLQLPPMCPYFILSLVFVMSFGALSSMPPPSNSKLRQNWKYFHKFRRRRLAYHLVIRCRRRVRQHPQRLDGTVFPSPCYVTYRSRRRKNPKANACHHRRQVIKS